MILDLDFRNMEVTPILSGDHYEIRIEGDTKVILKFDFETFDNIADDFRQLCNERRYDELLEDLIYLEAEISDLENTVDCLKEANDILRAEIL